MKSFASNKIHSSEITPEPIYRSRREFIKLAGLVTAGGILSACAPGVGQTATQGTPALTQTPYPDTLTPLDSITHYNNYYEFTISKSGVADLAKNFTTSPWDVQVSGLCNKPQTFSMEQILTMFPSQERVYRMRCVEDWSMVVPWGGFPLSQILNAVQPTSDAKYVKFTGTLDPAEMPSQQTYYYPWPYLEGLRMDEAMHDLTILATGLYGQLLEPQCGAPIRVVVPWKYGYKSIKALKKIELVANQPDTFWNTLNPSYYGFYSNVSPRLDATEQRIGESFRRPTLDFNGYADQVASLYAGMDLGINS